MLQLCLDRPLVTIMYGHFRQTHGWDHGQRTLSQHLLVFGHSGEAVFWIGEQKHTIRRGELIIVPANTPYRAETQNSFEYDFIHIDAPSLCLASESDVSKALSAHFKSPTTFGLPDTQYCGLFLDYHLKLGDLFEFVQYELARCRTYITDINPHKKVLLDLCVAQLLVHISERFSRQLVQTPAHPELLTRMLLWLRIHYAGDVTLTTLADHFGVSKAYTARLFRKHLSTTVTTYINELRLHHATELLRLSTMNISQIAGSVGFSNVYYFSRLFQQYFHISPSAYRRQGCL